MKGVYNKRKENNENRHCDVTFALKTVHLMRTLCLDVVAQFFNVW